MNSAGSGSSPLVSRLKTNIFSQELFRTPERGFQQTDPPPMMPVQTLPLPQAQAPDDLRQTPVFNEHEYSILNTLRLAAMGCRAAARTDLFEACALLCVDGEDARRTYIDTFVKCLPEALPRRIKWFRPGTTEISFDEAWVLRCLSRVAAQDYDSLGFLLRSQIDPARRRYIGFLLGRISEQFPKI
ncbi:hypothetical protein [Phaeobacter inhibens]|uniref:hypothetical protein n=1 Tax=Phaeobacter inhibens TaxID=221822 RepID=UPI0021A51415|nr:hypothetical protein [Phaeobacter inhibens]